jgi:hypothetical protein
MKTFTWLVAIALMSVSVEASGQGAVEWQRGTTLAGFVGASTASSETRPAAGTALGWEITPHFTLEGRGAWLPGDSGSTDFFAWLGAILPLRPAETFVPFASAGIGMYRATVEAASEDVPAFYRDRMSAHREVFEDFMLSVGGGADVFVTPHIAIRPEVSLLVVTSGSDARALAVYGVQVAYHFESRRNP